MSITLMYGFEMFFLGGWHWVQDDEASALAYLLDDVFWAGPVPGGLGLLGFLAGVAATVAVTCLAGVSARSPAARATPRAQRVTWQAGAVALMLGGGLATAHAWAERSRWSTITVMDDPTTGLLPAVHDVWEATVGLVSPGTQVVVLAVVGVAVLLLLALRRRTRSPA
jgi:hypothetical protein